MVDSMSFQHVILLYVTLMILPIVHQERLHGNSKHDEEQQLLGLLQQSFQHKISDNVQLISHHRHDSDAESHWRPVFDSDVNGRFVEPHSRTGNGLTADQQSQLVDEHNRFRRSEGAVDMEKLKWNAKLEKLAQAWTEKCLYTHGNPGLSIDDIGFTSLGQNNWIGSNLDIPAIVKDWYDEKMHFDYNSLQCTSGQSCDRYKQVVWSSTTDMGCATKQCNTIGGLSNALFVVCYYGPAGNWNGEKPFIKGPKPCTQCARGQFFCSDGLCDSQCQSSSGSCECNAECKNCGTPTSDCKCQCKDGSTGIDCSQKCEDLDERCHREKDGWPPVMCSPTFPFVIKACPKMCGKCRDGNPCGRYNSKYDIDNSDD